MLKPIHLTSMQTQIEALEYVPTWIEHEEPTEIDQLI